MCFIISDGTEGQTASLVGHRAIEVISCHQEQKQAEVIFLVCISNEKENNFLHFLHPGNVSCELMDISAGLPWHPDEIRINQDKKSDESNILTSIYGQMYCFDENDKKFHLKKDIAPIDLLCDLKKENQSEISFWPEDATLKTLMEPLCPQKDQSEFIPFSAWKAGPFSTGNFLIAIKTTLLGKSYEEFVESKPFFIVDGPKQLYNRIKHLYIPMQDKTEKQEWKERFGIFKNYLHFDESYDVIILREPFGDKVLSDLISSSKITEGSLELDIDDIIIEGGMPSRLLQNYCKRYVSTDSGFVLKLSYADGLFKDNKEISYVHESSPVPLIKTKELVNLFRQEVGA